MMNPALQTQPQSFGKRGGQCCRPLAMCCHLQRWDRCGLARSLGFSPEPLSASGRIAHGPGELNAFTSLVRTRLRVFMVPAS